jgi:hypothetical protein
LSWSWAIKDKKASAEHFWSEGCIESGREGCGHVEDEYDPETVYRWYKWYEICPCVCGGKLWEDLNDDGEKFTSDSQEKSKD